MNKPLEIVRILAGRTGLITASELEKATELSETVLRKHISIARRCLRGATIVRGKDYGYELTTDPDLILRSASRQIKHALSELQTGRAIEQAANNQDQIEFVMDDKRLAIEITAPVDADGFCVQHSKSAMPEPKCEVGND